ncbi:hypothetical protein L249_5483 [Ophiocordyceps polyrhachis-furcata BCC 54312]|uniref:Uncharacterized protein n=1 Tax=Ophiocordyceps polyrhachis-furcata BCC 54312 TaxID=1330021 RepID=A0A367LGS4_9HYPO|nr:hypothetical protein L249_5483 [Ophiocordyceps polyrhachis-furcata BCC 54312]
MDAKKNSAIQPDESAGGSAASHRRGASGGSSLLARLPFMRPLSESKLRADDDDGPVPAVSISVQHHHRTRRRRGSLRKVALLGRGAQRDKRDDRYSAIDTTAPAAEADSESSNAGVSAVMEHDALGLKIPRLPSSSGPDDSVVSQLTSMSSSATHQAERDSERCNLYTSTTDEEDLLHMPSVSSPPRASLSMLSGSDSYFATQAIADRRASFQQAKSPLSYSGISTNTLPPPASDWNYSETEWWGWVVVTVTWFVFVMGMGSCLDVWSWAWDVGKTPYAPPELEDDPTLPIVGYYPALIIMTGVMAWVWVVVAWVGMKYFRHAKISGD